MADPHKEQAVAFLKLASSGAVDSAFAQFVSVNFRHHNPWFEGSAEAIKKGMKENAAKNPTQVLDVQRAVGEGDWVFVHSHVRPKPTDLGVAVVHIFRFEEDRIVELWDVGQPVPDKSLNQYGMF